MQPTFKILLETKYFKLRSSNHYAIKFSGRSFKTDLVFIWILEILIKINLNTNSMQDKINWGCHTSSQTSNSGTLGSLTQKSQGLRIPERCKQEFP